MEHMPVPRVSLLCFLGSDLPVGSSAPTEWRLGGQRCVWLHQSPRTGSRGGFCRIHDNSPTKWTMLNTSPSHTVLDVERLEVGRLLFSNTEITSPCSSFWDQVLIPFCRLGKWDLEVVICLIPQSRLVAARPQLVRPKSKAVVLTSGVLFCCACEAVGLCVQWITCIPKRRTGGWKK